MDGTRDFKVILALIGIVTNYENTINIIKSHVKRIDSWECTLNEVPEMIGSNKLKSVCL